MAQEPHTQAQWSQSSWVRVFTCVLAIISAWWPVAAVLHIAVLCRYIRGPELALPYIFLVGIPSWLIGLLIAGSRLPRPGHQLERWVVFAVCCLPVPLIAFRIPVLVARVL
jgi:hypothetical protein